MAFIAQSVALEGLGFRINKIDRTYLIMNTAEIIFQNKKIRGIWRDEADESVWFEIFKYNEYRSADEAINKATTIFDIGAHAGFFTLYAKAINPKAQIICVEPDENNIEAINQNLKLNNMQSKVKVIKGALVSEKGDYILEISKDSHNHKVVYKDQKKKGRSIIGYQLLDLVAQLGVEVIDLLKMDIEGAEVGIIEAWNESDWSALRNIVLEYHGGDRPKAKIEKILREHGFSVRAFPSQFDKTMGIIFGRRKG